MVSTSVLVDIHMPTCITGHQLAMHSWISPQADLKEVQSTPKVVHFHKRGESLYSQPSIQTSTLRCFFVSQWFPCSLLLGSRNGQILENP